VRREALQQRQREAGGLPGARLGTGEDVAAGEDERNRLRLDGRGLGIAFAGDGANELGCEAEPRE